MLKIGSKLKSSLWKYDKGTLIGQDNKKKTITVMWKRSEGTKYYIYPDKVLTDGLIEEA